MTQSSRKRLAKTGQSRIRLHFLGATRTVTGSLHFFEYTRAGKTTRFFLDAGLNQETEAINFQNRLPSGVKAAEVDFGIFSHAHIDHTGYLPKLFKEGFRGPVYCTQATQELASILLPDCGYLQEEEAKRLNKRNAKKEPVEAPEKTSEKKGSKKTAKTSRSKREVQPLYTEQDAVASLSLLRAVDFNTPADVCDGVKVTFINAGHILGAAIVSLQFGEGSQKRTLVFTGDIGRPDMPLLQNVVAVKRADYIISEGTYGDRLHQKRNRQERLAEVINAAYQRASKPHKKFGHGLIIIPAFAVGRVQSVLYDLRQLMAEQKIPNIPVFVDSPMAIKATGVYRNHPELMNADAREVIADGTDLFRTPRYAELLEYKQSEALDLPASEPIIVVGSSGMAAGGRIVRHLQHRLPGEQNTVVFIGYQAEGTLGRQLLTPEVETVRIGGEPVRVNATVEFMQDYSGHGDYSDILKWLASFQQKPRALFLVHGNEESLEALGTRISNHLRWDVQIPRNREHIDLD